MTKDKEVLEVVMLYVPLSSQLKFEEDFEKASKYISQIQGYIRHSLRKCMEKDGKYLLLVFWKNLEDHTITFRESPQYLKWKELLHHYYDPFPIVEHYKMIHENP